MHIIINESILLTDVVDAHVCANCNQALVRAKNREAADVIKQILVRNRIKHKKYKKENLFLMQYDNFFLIEDNDIR